MEEHGLDCANPILSTKEVFRIYLPIQVLWMPRTGPLTTKPFNLKILFMRIKFLLNTLLTMALLCLLQNSYGQCTIHCPADITVSNDLHNCGAVVGYATPTLTGTCTGFTITTNHASGSFFPVGTTTVTATAKDQANHTSTCTFTVKVNDTEAPIISNLSA